MAKVKVSKTTKALAEVTAERDKALQQALAFSVISSDERRLRLHAEKVRDEVRAGLVAPEQWAAEFRRLKDEAKLANLRAQAMQEENARLRQEVRTLEYGRVRLDDDGGCECQGDCVCGAEYE